MQRERNKLPLNRLRRHRVLRLLFCPRVARLCECGLGVRGRNFISTFYNDMRAFSGVGALCTAPAKEFSDVVCNRMEKRNITEPQTPSRFLVPDTCNATEPQTEIFLPQFSDVRRLVPTVVHLLRCISARVTSGARFPAILRQSCLTACTRVQNVK